MKVCDNCQYPVVSITWYDIDEMYCSNCGATGDVGYGKSVKDTPELLKQLRQAERRRDRVDKIFIKRSYLQSEASGILEGWIV